MGIKIIQWLFPPKKKKETKPLTKSQKMNEELRQAFLKNRSIMKQKPTHREWMKNKEKHKQNERRKIITSCKLSPSEEMIEKIVDVHPMKQVAIMSLVQVGMFGFMLFSFFVIDLVVR